jgi:exopolyphosphatase/guanosine-5'-triphosphate,3'-diphosphate pyrophosphatase
VRLFDALTSEHGLDIRARRLLEVAAVLHDIGMFISNRAHHKHGQYIVDASAVFGLRKADRDIVSNVVRYHRKAAPSQNHAQYTSLNRRDRIVVCKLAALLRVADALDRAHQQRVRDFRIDQEKDQLIIHVAGDLDLSIEREGLASKGSFFSDVFGLEVFIT